MIEENELSEGWEWTTLNMVCNKIQDGSHFSPQIQYDEPGEGRYPYVTAKNIKESGLDLTNITYVDYSFHKTIYERCNPEYEDVLLTKDGVKTGVAAINSFHGEFSLLSSVALLKVRKDTIHPHYLKYYLNSSFALKLITGEMTGTAIKRIVLNKIYDCPVPLAPLPEQRRIVTAIEQQCTRLDAAVTALQHARTKLKRYRATVLKAAVEGKLTEVWRAGHPSTEPASALLERILVERRVKWEADQRAKGKDPAKVKYVEPARPDVKNLSDLPKGWCWLTLEQITSAVRPICYGILMPKENVPNGVLYVKVKDMKGDKINVDELHRTTFEIAAGYARASLAPGDLLLAIRGTYGRIAEVPDALDGANITQDTARLATTKLISSAYVAVHLRGPNSQKYFREVARGVAVKGVNIADVRLTPIKLPPFIEQQEIVSEVERRLSIVTQLEITVEANLKRAERLRQSILKEAFAGRLVPQDPHDEPASTLLERIRKEREEQKPGPIKKPRELKTISVPRMPDVEPVDIDASEMEQMDLWASIGSRE